MTYNPFVPIEKMMALPTCRFLGLLRYLSDGLARLKDINSMWQQGESRLPVSHLNSANREDLGIL